MMKVLGEDFCWIRTLPVTTRPSFTTMSGGKMVNVSAAIASEQSANDEYGAVVLASTYLIRSTQAAFM